MKTWVKFGLGVLTGSIAATVMWSYFFGISPLELLLCSDQVMSETLAPDGIQRAVVFTRGCGPPPENYTRVHIMRSGRRESLHERAGEVFVARGASTPVSVQWQGADQVVVRYPQATKVYYFVTR